MLGDDVGVAGEHDVLRKPQARHRGVADALLRRKGGAEAAAVVDAVAADGPTVGVPGLPTTIVLAITATATLAMSPAFS